ncbi:MAG TPA: DUF475 domain-containing protein [Candidatus Limnocylindrales bacterium]|nr:DUF475 domain-containing protein [Candidatus Limnocylindrales bacterium]
MGYFRNSFLVTGAGLALGACLGWGLTQSWVGALSTMFIVAVLAILEVSLSFDNAVVNAVVLKKMTPVWRHRFITWGIAIAVFGMRIVFPLIIVAVITHIDPVSALVMAVTDPDSYSSALTSAHISVSAFGGAFLAMVGLKHFFNHEKSVHWIGIIERPLTRLGRIEAVELGLVLLLLYLVSTQLVGAEQFEFLVAGIFGLVTYIAVDGVSALLDVESAVTGEVVKSGAASFLYLEVLDASFSFDGVIGAFALSNNLFIIAIGLGVGAMFVRSLTIMLVERETLASYRYLEHGAFYAIVALAMMMFLGAITDIPEVVTGLIGAGFIVTAFVDSIRYNRRALGSDPIAVPGADDSGIRNFPVTPDPSRSPVREPSVQSRPE